MTDAKTTVPTRTGAASADAGEAGVTGTGVTGIGAAGTDAARAGSENAGPAPVGLAADARPPAVIRPAEQPAADRGGGNRTIPLVTLRSGARQMLNGITVIAPGGAIPEHFHDCEESVIVLDGAGVAVVGGARHQVGPGDTTWIPPGLPHFFQNASATAGLRIFWTYASATATRTLTATGETRPVAAEHAPDRMVPRAQSPSHDLPSHEPLTHDAKPITSSPVTAPAIPAATTPATARSVPAAVLHDFARRAFVAAGLPGADADAIAALMVEADLVGADAHGIFRLPQYIRRIGGGAVNRTPAITVSRTAPATALVDGDNGMGHLVMARAAETAVSLAREAGVGWVGVRRSNHAGPASLYAAMPVAHGMVGIYSAVASANHMAPWGGVDALLGTNPLAIGVPAGDAPPIILDIATTVASYGTVKNYTLQGRQMPEGWMVDRADGTPLTDPARSAAGVLLPIGGYKGAGLALVLGLLAGTLNRAAVGGNVVDFNADDATAANTGHFILALDIARFLDPADFAAGVAAHVRELHASALLPGADAIRLPGEDRARRRAHRGSQGIPVTPALARLLDALGARLGIGPLP